MIRPHAETEAAPLHRLGIAAAEDLRRAVRTALETLFADFIKQLPNALNDRAAKQSNTNERRTLQDLGRVMTVQTQRWVDSFVEHVDAQLIGGSVPERPAPRDSGSGDDSVALANVELRAEGRYQKLVTELDARVNRVQLMLYVPVYTKALAPAGLCRALQDTADALGWPGRLRSFLFEQFDARVVPALEMFYRTLIATLKEIGAHAAKAAAGAAAPAAPPPPRRGRSPTAMQAPADVAKVDPETTAMLQNFALKSDGEGYTDGLLAADLLALADHKPLPGVEQDHGWVPIQRITLAGHFLNEVIADPMVPDELKPQHESVRFPLMKSALTDETLFTSSTHPLGSLVHELLLKSATSRITGSGETRRLAELLQQVLVQFDLAPEFVRQAMRTAPPIQDSQIQRFFELQRQQAQQRRDFVISEAKRIVVKQLEQLTFGRGVPQPAVKFLNLAWGPLLTKRLLQHGAEHATWKAGVALMEQLLDQLDARQPEAAAPPEWQELVQTLGKALAAEGMASEQLSVALSSLETARKTPITAPF